MILQGLRHDEWVAHLVLDVHHCGLVVIDGRCCEVMHEARRRALKRWHALIAVAGRVRASGTMLRQRVLVDVPLAAETLVDAGHLAGIDQAVHETGVAERDVALAEWSAGGSGCRGVAHEAVDGVLTGNP